MLVKSLHKIKNSPTIRRIVFDPVEHKYTDEDQSTYISVTQKLNKITTPFNEKYWAKVKAEERGVSVDTILAEWASIRDYANNKGNAVHSKLEDSANDASLRERTLGLLSTGKIPGRNPIWGYEIDLDIFAETPLAICYPKIFNLVKKYIEQGWKLYAEKRVYLWEYLICGTIDLLLVRGSEFIILDWKTNKDILKFEAGYYRKENGIKTTEWVSTNKKLLAPLNHLPECKGMIYTMQLSTYARIAEAWGYICRGLILCHILEYHLEEALDRKKESNATIQIYPINYLKNEATTLIAHDFNKPVSKKVDFGIR